MSPCASACVPIGGAVASLAAVDAGATRALALGALPADGSGDAQPTIKAGASSREPLSILDVYGRRAAEHNKSAVVGMLTGVGRAWRDSEGAPLGRPLKRPRAGSLCGGAPPRARPRRSTRLRRS